MREKRLFFSKGGAARFISHLDLMRTFQRAFQRAGIPIKHTEGFNPHASISIVLPLPVGFSSQCEILEFDLEGDFPADELPARLSAALPEGIVARQCRDAVKPAKKLCYVDYVVSMEYGQGVPAEAQSAFGAFVGQECLPADKKSKKARGGVTQVDLIPMIHGTSFEREGDALILNALLSAQNPGLNPELLVSAFWKAHPALAGDFATYHRRRVLDDEKKLFE